jgi:aerobic carbon-monoxide dehydrogenase medium subunit
MKPVDFCLHQPDTVADAVGLLSEYARDVKVLAGGQSLVPLLNFRLARPEHLVDIGAIASLAGLRQAAGTLVIGAVVRQAQAERSAVVADQAPLLAAALPYIAHPPVRSRGTVGGSLAHADPAAELPAVAVALDATVTAVSARGRRDIPAAEFFRGYLTTALDDDELLTEIRVPAARPHTGAAFLEVARRRGDFALVGVAAQLTMDGELVADARICVTGVDQVPFRCPAAEALLAGARPGPEVLAEAASAVRACVQPGTDLHATAAYRTDVAGTLTARALAAAARSAASGADRRLSAT